MTTRLTDLLKNRRWEKHSFPFPYVYAQDVFEQHLYTRLEYEYNNILSRGLSDKPAWGVFSRNMGEYDAYGAGFDKTSTALATFMSPEWHDMMASIFGIRGTGYINVGLHHHLVGSKNGFIHNDFNPVWFAVSGEGRIRTPNHALCSYKNGFGPLKAHEKIQVVRGVVMLYYIANGEWYPGDGGETGFFRGYDAKITEPVRTIPPYDNSIVMYECTPKSFHSFLSNKKKPRNCVIMWIHRPIEEAIELYGGDKLERWKDDEKE